MSHYMRAHKKQFVKNAQECIIKPLLRQRETGELCDVVLRLNGRRFYGHRAILALWSPYFLSMFTCDMREKVSKEIDLSESLVIEDDEVLEQIITYMYTGILSMTITNAEDILRITDFLLMDDVKEYCSQFYLELGNLDLTNCLRLRFLTENHNLLDVTNACQRMITSRFHDYLIFHNEILELPVGCLFTLLEDPKVVHHTSYNELKKLIQRWIDADKDGRERYQADLSTCIKLWVCEHLSESSHVFPEKSKCSTSVIMQPSTFSFSPANDHMSASATLMDESNSNSVVRKTQKAPARSPVLFAVVSNPGMRFAKILIYNIIHQTWLHFPMTSEKITHMIPARQAIGNMISHKNYLYLYCCSSFPYPTDMLKINILVIDVLKVQASLYSFRTVDFSNPCYRTTLTNCHTVPPAMVYCNHNLYIVGNKEGTGNLFRCNLHTQQYICYQIPGARFVSLARAAVKDDRFIFLWFRIRTGPSEEFSIKKSVAFMMFDVKSKMFNTWDMAPPDVSYDDFTKPYTLCCRDQTVLIYHPGKPTLVLDEVRYMWVTSLRKIANSPASSTDLGHLDCDPGFQLQTATPQSIFILKNEAPFTTSMHEVSESFPEAYSHTPPPIDNISMVTAGTMSSTLLNDFETFDRYDEVYTSALQVVMKVSDGETEDSGGTPEEHDSDNDYEYDEDIYDYDYDYDFDAEFSF